MTKRGRPRTIHVNRLDLLRGIRLAWIEDVGFLERELKSLQKNATGRPQFRADREARQCERHLQDLRKFGWVRYDLPRFMGRQLTASEKVVARRAMRRMAADGLIELAGLKATECRLTAKGLRELKRR